MQNKLTDLNNHLFAALERLNDENISQEQLEFEANRSKAVTNIAKTVIENASLILEAQKYFDEIGCSANAPAVLGLESDK